MHQQLVQEIREPSQKLPSETEQCWTSSDPAIQFVFFRYIKNLLGLCCLGWHRAGEGTASIVENHCGFCPKFKAEGWVMSLGRKMLVSHMQNTSKIVQSEQFMI